MGGKKELDGEERREGAGRSRGQRGSCWAELALRGSGIFIQPASKHDGEGRWRRGAALNLSVCSASSPSVYLPPSLSSESLSASLLPLLMSEYFITFLSKSS